MENTKIKGIIFDYGGTIDTRGVHWSWVIRDGYEAVGVPVGLQDFRDAYVYAERELARTRHIYPHHNFYHLLKIKMDIELGYLVEHGILSQGSVEKYAEPVAAYCYDAARNAVEDARPTLEALYQRYPLVLVSNFYGNVEAVLADFDLLRYFRQIIESAVVGVRKPDPAIFQLGVDALGLKPQEVLVIGDSYRKDIEPARKIGCQVAWLKGRGWTADEDAVEDSAMISQLGDVLRVAL
ncbi:MAG: HAD family hydrolase [Bacteroidales bacterium]|nr:HAD family hydrolase [Bacteroidales bacterium]